MIPLDESRIPSHTTHPGEFLHDEIVARKIKQNELAKRLGISPTILNEVIKGKRRVSISLCLALEKEWKISAELWLNLQKRYDRITTYHKYEAELKKFKHTPKKRQSILAAVA
jgi:addiction module HigA family antidote